MKDTEDSPSPSPPSRTHRQTQPAAFGPVASSSDSDDEALCADEATSVLQWQAPLIRDSEGLVRDLRAKYVSGVDHLPGGEWLSQAFSRLRNWCLVVGAYEAWASSPELVAMGNSVLQDVRLHHAYVTRGVSRQNVLRLEAHSKEKKGKKQLEEKGRKRRKGALGKRERRRTLTRPQQNLRHCQYTPTPLPSHFHSSHQSPFSCPFQKTQKTQPPFPPPPKLSYNPFLPNSSYIPFFTPHPSPTFPTPTPTPEHFCTSCHASRFFTCQHSTQKRQRNQHLTRNSNQHPGKRSFTRLGQSNNQKPPTSFRSFVPMVST